MKGDGRKIINGKYFPALHIPVGKNANRQIWDEKMLIIVSASGRTNTGLSNKICYFSVTYFLSGASEGRNDDHNQTGK